MSGDISKVLALLEYHKKVPKGTTLQGMEMNLSVALNVVLKILNNMEKTPFMERCGVIMGLTKN